jgi:two-component sensor histidine kinase
VLVQNVVLIDNELFLKQVKHRVKVPFQLLQAIVELQQKGFLLGAEVFFWFGQVANLLP